MKPSPGKESVTASQSSVTGNDRRLAIVATGLVTPNPSITGGSFAA